ncbi:MAG: hypothetical protein M0R33_03690 [Methylomonas sp.]|jgi:hypothetical protein|uniref:hypothetical protein n=1 Tax=Methylomonas sp. TaxID=418 RepID=UPI0025D2B550|nr:hypothetical protein [Methylomonas sp.]MCK9605538.1 hypothetical protein [Methylomonas sp.]
MKATVQLHNGDERTYEQADHVAEKDKYSIYIYGEDNRVLAILNKDDIKNLLTDETP